MFSALRGQRPLQRIRFRYWLTASVAKTPRAFTQHHDLLHATKSPRFKLGGLNVGRCDLSRAHED
jgi:hypothetical protein